MRKTEWDIKEGGAVGHVSLINQKYVVDVFWPVAGRRVYPVTIATYKVSGTARAHSKGFWARLNNARQASQGKK